ncbi:hypothetical protein AZ78_1398 [Lysobacter capsici AZ78]|uniref:Uncharacterized protein n=1 Tax=Lysobacter capsici AZ78 TaxID=1444315 RepID=A0A108U791_9GAMM|nr:hypothetical protein AZ78_1398 [Lysobacter capsici AZ78]
MGARRRGGRAGASRLGRVDAGDAGRRLAPGPDREGGHYPGCWVDRQKWTMSLIGRPAQVAFWQPL